MYFQERAALRRAVAAEKQQTTLRLRAEANEQKASSEEEKARQIAAFFQNVFGSSDTNIAIGSPASVAIRKVLDDEAGQLRPHQEGERRIRYNLVVGYEKLGEFG